MRYYRFLVLSCIFYFLWACSPTFNWRDIPPGSVPLASLFPCKPDQASRVVRMADRETTITMLGCEAGGAMFALAYADVKEAASADAALAQWRIATLATMRAQASSEVPFVIKGAGPWPQSVQVQARGSRADGSPLAVQLVWFAAGTLVFQALVYADVAKPAESDTFFSGLRFP